MTLHAGPTPSPPGRGVVAWGLLRSLLSMAVLVALYFLGPLDGLQLVPFGLSLALAAALLVCIGAWEIRAITRSPHPTLRGIQALAVTVPLYLLLFAAAYYAMAAYEPASFNVEGVTRIDMLYFTVTTFSSVGFGDVFAASQDARILVTVQMVLNLLVLGAGIRVFVGVARRSRSSRTPSPPIAAEPEL